MAETKEGVGFVNALPNVIGRTETSAMSFLLIVVGIMEVA